MSVTVAAAPAPDPSSVNAIPGLVVANPAPTEVTSILVTIISVIVIAAPTPESVFVIVTLGICVYPLPTFVISIEVIALPSVEPKIIVAVTPPPTGGSTVIVVIPVLYPDPPVIWIFASLIPRPTWVTGVIVGVWSYTIVGDSV